MLRLAAIFIAFCALLIAASLGVVLHLVVGLSVPEAAIASLAVLTVLTLYNSRTSRSRDRSDFSGQIADLSRASADIARQLAELGRRVAALESGSAKAKLAPDPLAAEIEEMGTLVKQLAETVAVRETAITAASNGEVTAAAATAVKPAKSKPEASSGAEAMLAAESASAAKGPFKGKSPTEIVTLIRSAVDANRMDLYLQPIVTLPQRKVRYYEGMTRLRNEEDELILPADFLQHAESAGLMPRIDNWMLFRCVQVLRRLLVKNRDIGLFCNISAAILRDAEAFPKFLQFMEANRALSSSLVLEVTQQTFSTLGPVEQESLAGLTQSGFRFSIDHVTNLRLDPTNLSERGIRFVKVPAALLLSRTAAPADIAASDLSDLLGRHGISLIAERIESETVVVNLLDYDVRFGQGFLFSPPRPVRAEALGVAERKDAAARDTSSASSITAAMPAPAQRASARLDIAARR
jgi:cyclic-di-GMP phosphodiesterase TipF (flagellum assembly factor)